MLDRPSEPNLAVIQMRALVLLARVQFLHVTLKLADLAAHRLKRDEVHAAAMSALDLAAMRHGH